MRELDVTTVTDRIKKHKDKLVNIVQPDICVERAIHYTEAYKEYEAEPIVIKRAYALKHHLENRTIWIDNDELIVGNQARTPRAAPIFPEYTVGWVEREIDDLADRPGAGFNVTQADKDALYEIFPFWHGRTVVDKCFALFSEEHKELLETVMIKAEGNMNSGDAHIAVNFKEILEIGISGIIEKTKKRRSRINHTDYEDFYKDHFLKAVEIAMQAMGEHINKYAELALNMSKEETRYWRKQELITIAENCKKIAFGKPETFHQALQLCYFVMLFLQIESSGHSVSFGRLDQYLYPWYAQDVEKNKSISREDAIELFHSCWLKLLEINKIRSGSHSKSSAGSPMYQNVTIGGQNFVDGKAVDAVNELSYTILESCGRLRSTQPNLSVRYHANTSDEFMDACTQVIRCGFGMPAFNNDEIVIPEFIKMGVEEADAYEYSAIGCIETAVAGKWGYRCTGMSFINFTRVAMATLYGGMDTTSKKVFLPHDKSIEKGNFNNYQEIKNEWARQIEYYTRKSIEIEYIIDIILEENAHDIICSALVDDCIEKGKTLKQGGAKYDWVSGLQVGIANTGNSLAAIKYSVFDKKLLTQQQIHQALVDDFNSEQSKKVQDILLNQAPKYGNDDDYVDLLLVDLYDDYIYEIAKYKNTRYGRGSIGGTYYAGTSSISANVPFGAKTNTTPDGRKAWTPLAEGCSPSSSTDVNGPTAALNSVGKLRSNKILGGVLLNQKLNPQSIDNKGDRAKLIMMLRTFFEDYKGWHVQYNIVDRDTLLAAKKEPDKHRDLVVRVAGYSAFFTALSPDTQDDIIARTEHNL